MEDEVRILVVDDDETLCDTLQFNLELEGYKADKAYSAEEAMKLDLIGYDLILLDVMMGKISGFRFAKQLKENSQTADIPIIFCTAKDNEDDMVTGFNIGAEDYIYKPYTIRNVLIRIKAVLKRSRKRMFNTVNEVEYKGIRLDRDFKRCRVDGKEIKLVRKEFEVLDLLISNAGRIFSREEILEKVWHGEVVVLDRTVDVNITRIRQKIAPYGIHLITRSGYGYGFE